MSFLNETNITFIVRPLYPPRPIQFSILLFFMIISIPCFIFLFYHFLTNRILYSALHNHVIILLLISNAIQTVTDVPVLLSYYYTGIFWPSTVQFCTFHFFIDYDLFTTCFLLLTWASFERHILIFHIHYHSTYFKRLIRHYIPLGFCCIYPLLYYIIFMLFYPCKNYYDMTTENCLVPCYLLVSHFMALYEQIVHGIALMFLILFFNLALIIRVLRQKRRMGRQLTSTRNRKMTVQLLSITFLFIITNSGYFIIQIGQLLGYENFGISVAGWLYPLSMCMPLLVPFMCLNGLQDLKKKLKRLIPFQRNITVAPINLPAVKIIRHGNT